MKILEDAVKKFGGMSEVQAQLIKRGLRISHTALYNSIKGDVQKLRPDVLVALVELVYDGDWVKAGKALKSDVE